jgi:hypothetical protein
MVAICSGLAAWTISGMVSKAQRRERFSAGHLAKSRAKMAAALIAALAQMGYFAAHL